MVLITFPSLSLIAFSASAALVAVPALVAYAAGADVVKAAPIVEAAILPPKLTAVPAIVILLLASFALVTAPLAIVVATDHPPLLEAEPVTSPVRDTALFVENSVAVAAVVAVDALPVKLPSTLPLRLPLIVLVNLAEPVTNKESAVKLSTSVSFLKVVLLLKILAPVIVCSVSVVTRLGLFVTLAQATDFAVFAVLALPIISALIVAGSFNVKLAPPSILLLA